MLKTGFKELDEIVQMEKQDLIIVAGRPAMGKTNFVSNILSKVNEINTIPVLMISLEESKEKIKNRILTNRQEKDFKEIYIEDVANISIMEIREIAKKYKKEKNIELMIIDYFQLIAFNRQSVLSRDNEIIEIAKSLKELSVELDISIIVTSQLSRSLEEREDKSPLLTDFYESKIVEYADTILFIYRDDYYNKDSERKNIADFIIAKNKNDRTGRVELTYIEEIKGYIGR